MPSNSRLMAQSFLGLTPTTDFLPFAVIDKLEADHVIVASYLDAVESSAASRAILYRLSRCSKRVSHSTARSASVRVLPSG